MEWLIYWIMILDNIREATAILCVISTLAFCGFMTGVFANLGRYGEKEMSKRFTKWAIGTGIVFGITLLLCVFIPNTKQAATIYVLPKLMANEQVQKLPENVVKLFNDYVEEKVKK